MDTIDEDAERFYATGELLPMPHVTDACRETRGVRIPLARPFQNYGGHAYAAALTQEGPPADDPQAPRRSPLLLCEGERIVGDGHSDHDDIRRRGQGNFSHWRDRVYFSSTDGSDPNRNGREYFMVLRDTGLGASDRALRTH